MITGVIKNKVDKIWTDIWAGGNENLTYRRMCILATGETVMTGMYPAPYRGDFLCKASM